MGYKSIRTLRHKYISYTSLEDMDEFYDLQEDPYEMRNLIDDEASEKAIVEIKAEMFRIMERSAFTSVRETKDK